MKDPKYINFRPKWMDDNQELADMDFQIGPSREQVDAENRKRRLNPLSWKIAALLIDFIWLIICACWIAHWEHVQFAVFFAGAGGLLVGSLSYCLWGAARIFNFLVRNGHTSEDFFRE